MDAISLLKADHAKVTRLFDRFQAAGPNAHKQKRTIVDDVITELSIHAAIEEQVLYPIIKTLGEHFDKMVLQALEEHHGAKAFLAELARTPAGAERFDAKMAVLMTQVRHHIDEEENDLFPRVEKVMEPDPLDRLGKTLEQAKAGAPTRPHPLQPDTPPLNVLLGLPVAVLDRAITAGRETIGRLIGARS